VFEKAGYLDEENYFMYFEDIDWSYQMYKNNIKILYVPQVKIIHYGGESSKKDPDKKNAYYEKGLKTYLKKNRGWLIMKLNSFVHILK
jgi:GT2 family glycosyltransferase